MRGALGLIWDIGQVLSKIFNWLPFTPLWLPYPVLHTPNLQLHGEILFKHYSYYTDTRGVTKLLGEHGKEASQKITELEALCKRLREDAQKLKEEKATLEGMVESHDELIMKIAKEIWLDPMGEDGEDEHDDSGGGAAAPLAPVPPAAAAPEEIVMEEDPVEMVTEQEAPVVHEVILAIVEPELP
jgi:hypothetical protein